MPIEVYIPKTLTSYENDLDLSFHREFKDNDALIDAFVQYEGEDLRNLVECQIKGASEDFTVCQALMCLETSFEEQPYMLDRLNSGWERYHNICH